MEFNKLTQIGLTEGEIKVYEALLHLGESTKTSLAKQSGIAPSNIYDVTNRLLEKGIISKVEKNGVAHFSPANPKHLLDFIKQKEAQLNQERLIVETLIPSLLMRFQERKERVNVEAFTGWTGLKTVFEDLVTECNANDVNYVFGASKGESDKNSDLFFLKYSKIRAAKRIPLKIIFNEDMRQRQERIGFFQKSKLCDVKFLEQSTPTEILLYKDKTSIIILSKDPLVIRVTSKEVKESFQQHFELMWKMAKV
ncbi:MAG: helix-turn-helix domain-containing protein [Candidatus Woesearchaeota archaeon]